MTTDAPPLFAPLEEITPDLAELYKDLHEHPELSHHERRTAAAVAERVQAMGYEVATEVGGTGVVGRLENGAGPTVLLRADMDALPVEEKTGLPYASTATGTDPAGKTVPVMHACGHDMHVACLVGAADLLARGRDAWSGTLLTVFQPAEEIGDGAQKMVDDDMFARFGRPDVVLGQHVVPMPAGLVALRSGPSFAATDAWRIRLFGRGAHGSKPEAGIDPVVMAAAVVMRLQTVVSREIGGADMAVVTIGSLHAGHKDNIIPDEAELTVNIRSYIPEVRERVLTAVRRIINAEAEASGAEREPEISTISEFPVLNNDAAAVDKTTAAMRSVFGDARVIEAPRATASEDVGVFGTAAGAPTCYWLYGGTDPDLFAKAAQAGRVEQDIPSNHQSTFAPLVEPTLTTGIQALTTAAHSWLH